jgi:hypothetical protein
MNSPPVTNEPRKPEEPPDQPKTRTALHGTELLVSGYVGISVLILVAIVLLSNHAAVVNPAVWIRGSVAVATALLMLASPFARLMALAGPNSPSRPAGKAALRMGEDCHV